MFLFYILTKKAYKYWYPLFRLLGSFFYINNIEGKFLISDPYKTMYIWDAGNLKSLPIDLFMDE